MAHVHEVLRRLQFDSQFLGEFARERLPGAFAAPDLAPGKLPQAAERSVAQTLGDEYAAVSIAQYPGRNSHPLDVS